MTQKIRLAELRTMLMDPSISEKKLRPYLSANKASGGPFTPGIRANPATVVMTEDELTSESAMSIGNDLCRWRRKRKFLDRMDHGDTRPVLVSEGDSWFQFPFMLDDVIDQLETDYTIWSVGAAGDTAKNMLMSKSRSKKTEYLTALKANARHAEAFLLSAAGNDVIGEGEDGKPVLGKLLKTYTPVGSAEDHIDWDEADKVFAYLRRAYGSAISSIRQEAAFAELPILIHGYDYAIPGSFNDPRNPAWAARDEWLGGPLSDRLIQDEELRCDIIRTLIDRLYVTLNDIAGDSTDVHVVDTRGTLVDKSDWADEIHPTDEGFAKIAAVWRSALASILGS